MKRFLCFAGVMLATLLIVTSNIHAQSAVYQFFDQSEQFDGSQCQSFDDTQGLFNDSFTITMYVSVSNLEGRHAFFAKSTAANRGIWVGIDDKRLYVEAYEDALAGNFIYAPTEFPVNRWVFVTVKYNAQNGTIQVEQDGEIVRIKTGVSSINQNSEPGYLGCYIPVPGTQYEYFLTGKLQGVRFYADADLNVAQPTPDGSPQNPTPEPTDDPVATSTPTPDPSDDDPPRNGGDSDAVIDLYSDEPAAFTDRECQLIDNAADVFADNFTINAQVKPTREQFRHVIVSQEVLGDRGLVFMIQDGKPVLQIHSTNADSEFVEGTQEVPLNVWSELTATYSDGTVTLELNGVEVARQENVPAMRASTAPTRAGCYLFDEGTNRWYMEGEIQNLRLYDSATTITPEITPTPTPEPDPNATPNPADSGEVHTGSPGSYGGTCNTIDGTETMLTGDWTVSAYVRLFEEQDRHPIIAKEGNEERGMLLEFDEGKVTLQVYADGSIDPVVLQHDSVIPLNVWTHVAARYSNGFLSLWVNGTEVAGKADVAPVATNDQNLNLGCYEWNEEFKWYLFGQLQDVTFVDSAVDITQGTVPSDELPPAPTAVYEEFPGTVEVFNGTTCTTIDDSADIFAGNWTAEFQFRMTQAQGRQPIFSDMQSGTGGRGLLFSVEENELDPSQKELVLEIFSDDFTGQEIIGDRNIPVGEWVHASVSYNNGTVRMYVDGVLVASQSGVPPVQYPNSAPLRVGCYYYDSEFSYNFVGEMSNARFYSEATNPTPGTTPIPPASAAGPAPVGYERGRVTIVGGNLVTENGRPIRGEHMVFANGISPGFENSNGWSLELMYDRQLIRSIRDNYKLNAWRLMMSRPPQNWGGGPGNDCSPPGYRCYSLDYVHPNGKTTLQVMDDIVKIMADLGMYLVIDYHPVLGHDKGDASLWWSRVAPRYKDHTHVIYELINEPWNEPSYPGDLVDFEESLYTQVRAAAPDTHIIVWSFPNTRTDMSVAVGQGSDIDYTNASVGFHPYDWPTDAGGLTATKESISTFRQSYPIISTEIGGDRLDRVRDMEELGISWIGLDNVKGLPGLENASDTHGIEDVFWDADPDAVDKTAPQEPTNQAPLLSPLTDQISLVGDTISIQIAASDPDGNALIFSTDGLPPGLTIDATTGLITGRIAGPAAAYTVLVSVSDGAESSSNTFTWTIQPGPLYLPMTLQPQ